MKLKQGASIQHRKKKHVGEIPGEIFKEIYGNLGSDEKESKKLFDSKVKKFKFVAEKEPVEDEPKKSSD